MTDLKNHGRGPIIEHLVDDRGCHARHRRCRRGVLSVENETALEAGRRDPVPEQSEANWLGGSQFRIR